MLPRGLSYTPPRERDAAQKKDCFFRAAMRKGYHPPPSAHEAQIPDEFRTHLHARAKRRHEKHALSWLASGSAITLRRTLRQAVSLRLTKLP
jgi:hypothetical protein